MIERKVSLGFLLALLVQTGGALMWAGAAAQKIEALEAEVLSARPVYERLARVEAELEVMRTQLTRIEDKIDRL